MNDASTIINDSQYFLNNLLEPQADAKVRAERNGVPLHRRVEIFNQPTDGQLRIAPCVQRRGRF